MQRLRTAKLMLENLRLLVFQMVQTTQALTTLPTTTLTTKIDAQIVNVDTDNDTDTSSVVSLALTAGNVALCSVIIAKKV